LITALYFAVLRYDPKKPEWPGRDRFHLSKGHCCPLLYAVLSEAGFFPREKLWTLRKLGSMLQGHPDRRTPGIEAASGSLGQGLSVALGMSLAARIDLDYRVYCLLGDGNPGRNVWEGDDKALPVRQPVRLLDYNGIRSTGDQRDHEPEPLSPNGRPLCGTRSR
jgi:transketolase